MALEAALAELVPWAERGVVGAAANAALEGGLDEEQSADVERVVARLEAALRARVLEP